MTFGFLSADTRIFIIFFFEWFKSFSLISKKKKEKIRTQKLLTLFLVYVHFKIIIGSQTLGGSLILGQWWFEIDRYHDETCHSPVGIDFLQGELVQLEIFLEPIATCEKLGVSCCHIISHLHGILSLVAKGLETKNTYLVLTEWWGFHFHGWPYNQ